MLVDVHQSFPMHQTNASKNYAWLPWNVDPSIPTPDEYIGMRVQPLGDRQQFYDDFIQGCVDFYGNRGFTCLANEVERIAMDVRQPKVC
jgi:hypothetical protein